MSEVFMFLILMFVVITLNLTWENEKTVEISCLNVLSGKNCQPNRSEQCISINNNLKSPYRRQII
jgi:hypothetical protein